MSTYLTVAIPYVNATPHLGYAFELIEADLAARARRASDEPVRFLGGTDDYSLKNVLAADAAGVSTRRFVDEHADHFEALAGALGVEFDDFIRTSRDPRHRPAVERLWRACRDAGDLERRAYEGRYCVGCERFYDDADLIDGECSEHRVPLDTVAETNWFFRLSRYQDRLIDLVERGELAIEPEQYRTEVLSFLRSGVRDISVSRSSRRARGWGIPVPDDPDQVVYVWFDALTNYISALDYGSGGAAFDEWWVGTDERIHVIGKGILRFHAVYWPAFLLSAGQPLPTRLHVHPYLTVDGAKLSKSAGGHASPVELVETFGTDSVRWWCAQDVSTTTDTDFSIDRLVSVADRFLANGLGNTASRITTLVSRHLGGTVPGTGATVLPAVAGLRRDVLDRLGRFDRTAATGRIVDALDDLNRYLEQEAPWRLVRDDTRRREVERVVDLAVATLHEIADAATVITPAAAAAVAGALDRTDRVTAGPVIPRLATRDHASRPDRPC